MGDRPMTSSTVSSFVRARCRALGLAYEAMISYDDRPEVRKLYADKKIPVTSGLGGFLAPAADDVVAADFGPGSVAGAEVGRKFS